PSQFPQHQSSSEPVRKKTAGLTKKSPECRLKKGRASARPYNQKKLLRCHHPVLRGGAASPPPSPVEVTTGSCFSDVLAAFRREGLGRTSSVFSSNAGSATVSAAGAASSTAGTSAVCTFSSATASFLARGFRRGFFAGFSSAAGSSTAGSASVRT